MTSPEEATPPATPISNAVVAAFAAPAVPVSFLTGVLAVYFLKYGTDVLGLSAAALGIVFGVSRLLEGLANPVVGFLSDRTRHRLGRRRSWMLLAALPIPIASLMAWAPPAALGPTGTLACVSLGLLVLLIASTAVELPREALAVELSPRASDRGRLYASNGVALQIGSLLGMAVGVGLLRTADAPRSVAFWMFSLAGIATVAATSWSVARLREPPENLGRGSASPLPAYAGALRNPHQQRLLLVQFFSALPMGAMGALAPYMLEYVMGRADLTEAWMICFFVPHLASIPLWLRLMQRYRKLHLWIASLVLTIGAYAALYLVVIFTAPIAGAFEIGLALATAIFLGVAMGCGLVAPRIIGAEVIDWDELQSGDRREGVYGALNASVFRVASAFSITVAGFALDASGFVPGAEQTETVKQTITTFMAVFPALGAICSIPVLLGFRLTEQEHDQILTELERRRVNQVN